MTDPAQYDLSRVHLIGIGGSGMSGLAGMFLDRGIRVSGSDRADSAALRALADRGATVHVGHDAANLPDDVDTVVHTGAIWPENPEFLLAKERGLHVIHRSQALHWLIGSRRLVSVAGAHGKTTSTGMIVTALRGLGEASARDRPGRLSPPGRVGGPAPPRWLGCVVWESRTKHPTALPASSSTGPRPATRSTSRWPAPCARPSSARSGTPMSTS